MSETCNKDTTGLVFGGRCRFQERQELFRQKMGRQEIASDIGFDALFGEFVVRDGGSSIVDKHVQLAVVVVLGYFGSGFGSRHSGRQVIEIKGDVM